MVKNRVTGTWLLILQYPAYHSPDAGRDLWHLPLRDADLTGIAKSLPFLQQIRRMAVRACRSLRHLVDAAPRSTVLPGISPGRHFWTLVGMTRLMAGRQEILRPWIASATGRGTVPSVTAPSRVWQANMLKHVSESGFAANVDRHNRLAGSGDNR